VPLRGAGAQAVGVGARVTPQTVEGAPDLGAPGVAIRASQGNVVGLLPSTTMTSLPRPPLFRGSPARRNQT
jgi:hypothetical protein